MAGVFTGHELSDKFFLARMHKFPRIFFKKLSLFVVICAFVAIKNLCGKANRKISQLSPTHVGLLPWRIHCIPGQFFYRFPPSNLFLFKPPSQDTNFPPARIQWSRVENKNRVPLNSSSLILSQLLLFADHGPMTLHQAHYVL